MGSKSTKYEGKVTTICEALNGDLVYELGGRRFYLSIYNKTYNYIYNTIDVEQFYLITANPFNDITDVTKSDIHCFTATIAGIVPLDKVYGRPLIRIMFRTYREMRFYLSKEIDATNLTVGEKYYIECRIFAPQKYRISKMERNIIDNTTLDFNKYWSHIVV